MADKMCRRKFLQAGMFASAVAPGFVSNEEHHLFAALDEGVDLDRERGEHETSSSMPMGKIGDIEFSRLIAGGNLLSGWCHQRDLLYVAELAEAYLTEKKQFDTLQLMEENGINAIVIDQVQLPILKAYKKARGGKMKTICCVRQGWETWERPSMDEVKTVVNRVIENGADILFTHGGYSDQAFQSEDSHRIEVLVETIAHIQNMGVPAGVGSHSIYVPMGLDKEFIIPDFYFKTHHHDKYWSAHPREHRRKFSVDSESNLDHNKFHDNIFDLWPEKTAEYMKKKEQPWIGFKILAGGAIHPKSALDFAFESGIDFATVGMFDFNVIETSEAARNAVAKHKNRKTRPWRA